MLWRNLPAAVLVFGLAGNAAKAVLAEETSSDAAARDREQAAGDSAANATKQPPAADANRAADVKPGDELRGKVRSALHRPVRELAKAPYREARAMVMLLIELRTDESLPSAERERFANSLRTRLAQVRGAIARSLRRQQTNSARAARKSDSDAGAGAASAGGREGASGSEAEESPARRRSEGEPAGGGAQNDAAELIDLIETTIAPESWESRGGRGVVKYWSPGMALVIRQTDEVHEQIGGLARGMRN